MSTRRKRRGWAGGAVALLILAALGPGAPLSSAAGPPLVGELWSSAVLSSSARLHAEIDPNELTSAYQFEYITEAAYQANLKAAKDSFTGALKSPPLAPATIVPNGPPAVTRQLFGLSPGTAYRYRVMAKNPAGSAAPSEVNTFTTQSIGGGALLPDSRGWEMVSPVEKNGGRVEVPRAIAGGGVLQAAANGASITYGSRASFAAGAGAPPASQYIAIRTSTGWSTQNITAPLFSGTYDTEDQGVPYQLFSGDLARALLLNGDHCRGEGTDCAVANPPLTGTDAPPGYQNYYLRENDSGGFAALLSSAAITGLKLDPAHFDLRFAGASPDLHHLVLSTCAALTPDALEIPLGEGCDSDEQNLYLWSAGAGISLINLLPAQAQGNPGAALAAQSGAVSSNGARIYWKDLAAGNLYLRDGAQTKLVDATASFEAATPDGLKALFTKAGHLYRHDAATQSSTDLTPSGGVVGVLGASEDATRVYYQDASGLKLWQSGVTTTVAPGADASYESNYPPTTGTARVSASGSHLLFVSKAQLSGYDNTDLNTKAPDSQVFLYDAIAKTLICVSCTPTNARPIGPSAIPGAIANGSAPGSTHSYKPRVLSSDGQRVFFESGDSITSTDTNSGAPDVYQWEAQGKGSCTRPGGCIALISSGRSPGGATLIDSSADGSDVFFLTDDSLVNADPGGIDLYNARIEGGFPEPPPPIPCQGDACQFLPSQPTDPTLTTLLSGPGNPKVRFQVRLRCKEGFRKQGKRCVRKRSSSKAANRHKRRGGR